MDARPQPALLPRIGLALLVAAVLGSGLTPFFVAPAAQASTAQTMQADLLGWVNASRAKLGLRALRSDPRLVALAADRNAIMVSKNSLSHTVSGCLSCQLTARGIQWYSVGEVLGENNYTWGYQSALELFNWWKGSSLHWSILMSHTLNYIGIAVAYRSANRTTWGDIVLTESVDHTSPWARMATGRSSGTTATWTWNGGDIWLQTHTAGLRGFDVDYRVDSGSWSQIRTDTTAKSLSLGSRAHGHYYGLRVRSRDWRGHTSGWSAETRIWIG
jgi:uncharacterized protein YkwD